MNKEILLGDEAVALGAVHAGLTAGLFLSRDARLGDHGIPDPGLGRQDEVHRRLVRERKNGLRGGPRRLLRRKRALVSMKHVGLNVAADPFMSSVADRGQRRVRRRRGRRSRACTARRTSRTAASTPSSPRSSVSSRPTTRKPTT